MAIEISGLPSAALSSNGETAQTNASTNATQNPAQPAVGNNQSQNSPPQTDVVTLTRNAENLRLIEADINAASEIDGERIESLRLAIDTGAYNIDPLRVAEKFLKFESELTA